MKTRFGACAAAAFLALLLPFGARAQLFRAYLASTGSDANSCTLPAPCRLLPAALAAVADGGEVWMLDSANFNTSQVDVGKNVSIQAVPGAVGSLVVASDGSNALHVSGDSAVLLRNLRFTPLQGHTGDAVLVDAVSALTVDRTEFLGINGNAISTFGHVHVADSTIEQSSIGIRIFDGSVDIFRTKMIGNSDAIFALDNATAKIRASISESVISGATANGGHGNAITASATQSNTSIAMSVTRSTLTSLSIGFALNGASGPVAITLSHSMLSEAVLPWQTTGAPRRREHTPREHPRPARDRA